MNLHLPDFLKFRHKIPKKDILITLIVILVGTAGFALGKLSGLFYSREPVRIEYGDTLRAEASPEGQTAALYKATSTQPTIVTPANTTHPSGSVVAAKKGTKYYLPTCSGAKRISEANKIWFSSPEGARKMGLEPSTTCPGLK